MEEQPLNSDISKNKGIRQMAQGGLIFMGSLFLLLYCAGGIKVVAGVMLLAGGFEFYRGWGLYRAFSKTRG